MAFSRNRLAQFLLIQAASFSASLIVFSSMTIRSGMATAVLAGMLAWLVAWRCGSERWWQGIHLGFPVAAAALTQFDIPPAYFLAAFLVLAGFNWHAARNRVPYFPSGQATWGAVAQHLPASGAFRFVDIGSGLGGLNFYLANRFPDGRFTGVEISPLPWLISVLRNWFGRNECQFLRQDFNELDLSGFDVVFAYLSPAVMPAIWEKAQREMRSGSMLLSFEFEVPGAAPSRIVAAGMGGRPLYRWDIGIR